MEIISAFATVLTAYAAYVFSVYVGIKLIYKARDIKLDKDDEEGVRFIALMPVVGLGWIFFGLLFWGMDEINKKIKGGRT